MNTEIDNNITRHRENFSRLRPHMGLLEIGFFFKQGDPRGRSAVTWPSIHKGLWSLILPAVLGVCNFSTSQFSTSQIKDWKRWNRGKISIFLARVTLKLDQWPWKTIGILSYAFRVSVKCFTVIWPFKGELSAGIAQIGVKSALFRPMWPWNLTDDLEKQ